MRTIQELKGFNSKINSEIKALESQLSHWKSWEWAGELPWFIYMTGLEKPIELKDRLDVLTTGRSFSKPGEWIELGFKYLKLKQPGNSKIFFICCSKAFELGETSQAPYCLGLAYELGLGVAIDIAKAKNYYEKSLSGFLTSLARQRLLKINHSGITTADQWHDLGETYYKLRDLGNYKQAHACYELALSIDKNYAKAHHSLGILYHLGHGVGINLNKAREYYTSADMLGFTPARLKLKKFEKNNFQTLVRSKKDVNELDDKNNTLLHKVAEQRNLKNAARLLIMGASKEIKNSRSEKPFFRLDEKELSTITTLQTQICQLALNLEEPASAILVRRICIKGTSRDSKQIIEKLDLLYKHEDLRPLFDLAKLSALALHNLSKRKKFENDDYDSDEDINEEIKENQHLTIVIDPDSPLVDGIAHFDSSGLGGKNALGVYLQKNEVFIGGKRNEKQQFRGTFLHELTHFIAHEVFENGCNPYSSTDEKNRQRFTGIANELEKKVFSLDDILQAAFSPNYRKYNHVHGELIVRVAQMIVHYSDGLLRLQTQAPALLYYYRDVFLGGIKKHIEFIETRALSGWSRKCFINEGKEFHFESFLAEPKSLPVSTIEPPQTEISASLIALSQAGLFSDPDSWDIGREAVGFTSICTIS